MGHCLMLKRVLHHISKMKSTKIKQEKYPVLDLAEGLYDTVSVLSVLSCPIIQIDLVKSESF